MLLPCPRRHGVRRGAAPRHQGLAPRVAAAPPWQAALSQEVLVVEAQFLQAGPSDTRQFELGFLGCSRGLAALGDILHAGTGGLHHLVARAAVLFNIAVAKTDRNVVHELRHLKTLQVAISAVLRNEVFGHAIVLCSERAILDVLLHPLQCPPPQNSQKLLILPTSPLQSPLPIIFTLPAAAWYVLPRESHDDDGRNGRDG